LTSEGSHKKKKKESAKKLLNTSDLKLKAVWPKRQLSMQPELFGSKNILKPAMPPVLHRNPLF
jgi:hypothetical protein|tara:strand:- start:416 stop:604 length:189 start_codon:yes stop_codon:yes gene_type:complete